jgi:hypothetical protein
MDVVEDITEAPMTDDELLNYTQGVRVVVVKAITNVKPGDVLNVDDPKLMSTLAKFADGIDKQIIGRRRIDAANKTAGGLSDIANALDSYIRGKKSVSPGFKRHDEPSDIPHDGPSNLHSINLPKKDFIEGQLSTSGTSIDLDAIRSQGVEKQRSGAVLDDDVK